MQHFTYVTPAGICCSCNFAVATAAGGEASRRAYQHGETIAKGDTQVVIDYRHQYPEPQVHISLTTPVQDIPNGSRGIDIRAPKHTKLTVVDGRIDYRGSVTVKYDHLAYTSVIPAEVIQLD